MFWFEEQKIRVRRLGRVFAVMALSKIFLIRGSFASLKIDAPHGRRDELRHCRGGDRQLGT